MKNFVFSRRFITLIDFSLKISILGIFKFFYDIVILRHHDNGTRYRKLILFFGLPGEFQGGWFLGDSSYLSSLYSFLLYDDESVSQIEGRSHGVGMIQEIQPVSKECF